MNVIQETTAGGNLGNAFGTGLGAGLQSLANMKLNEITAQKQQAKASQFWKGLGLNDQMANQFASAPESIQKSLLDRLEGVNVGGQQPGQETQGQGVTIGANPVERRANAALEQTDRLAKEKAAATLKAQAEDRKVQERQNLLNEPQNKKIAVETLEDYQLAEKYLPVVEEMLALEKKKNLYGGAAGYLPNLLTSDDSARYNQLAEQLAAYKVGELGGQATGLKLKFAKDLKPNLTMKQGPRTKALKALEKQFKNASSKYQAFEEVKNDTNALKNLDKSIKIHMHKMSKQEPEVQQKLAVGSTIDTSSIDKKSIPVGALGNDENGNPVKWDGSDWIAA